MEITKQEVEAEVLGQGLVVETGSVKDVCVTDIDDLDIKVEKKEYTLVGDDIYTKTSVNEMPQWLANIIDDTVEKIVAGKTSQLDEGIASINQALLELDVAKNQYQELINIESTIDGIVTSKVETLNATIAENSANIISLDVTKATPTQALALSVDHLNAQINNGQISSLVTELNSSIANVDYTQSSSITALESSYNDSTASINEKLITNATAVSANATAITDLNAETEDGLATAKESLESYVGRVAGDGGNTYTYTQTAELLVSGVAVYPSNAEIASSNGGLTGVLTEYEYESNQTPVAVEDAVYKDVGSGIRWYYDSGTAETPVWNELVPVYADWAPSEGDVLVLTHSTDTTAVTEMFQYDGIVWGPNNGDGLVAKSNWAVDLEAYLTNDGGTYGADSSLASNITTRSDGQIQTAFEYGSNITIDGVTYYSGFGMTNSTGTQWDGNDVNSEFWIDADKFRMVSDSVYVEGDDPSSPFTVTRDTGGNHTTEFNGTVNFSNTDMNRYDNVNTLTSKNLFNYSISYLIDIEGSYTLVPQSQGNNALTTVEDTSYTIKGSNPTTMYVIDGDTLRFSFEWVSSPTLSNYLTCTATIRSVEDDSAIAVFSILNAYNVSDTNYTRVDDTGIALKDFSGEVYLDFENVDRGSIGAPVSLIKNLVITKGVAPHSEFIIPATTINGSNITSNFDTTTINGGQIATDTITANQIATDTITANQIATDTITANQIATDTITTDELKAGTIEADKIKANNLTKVTEGSEGFINSALSDTVTVYTGDIATYEYLGNLVINSVVYLYGSNIGGNESADRAVVIEGWDGSSWVQIGSTLGGAVTGTYWGATVPAICIGSRNVPYVTYSKIRLGVVLDFNGTFNNWGSGYPTAEISWTIQHTV